MSWNRLSETTFRNFFFFARRTIVVSSLGSARDFLGLDRDNLFTHLHPRCFRNTRARAHTLTYARGPFFGWNFSTHTYIHTKAHRHEGRTGGKLFPATFRILWFVELSLPSLSNNRVTCFAFFLQPEKSGVFLLFPSTACRKLQSTHHVPRISGFPDTPLVPVHEGKFAPAQRVFPLVKNRTS